MGTEFFHAHTHRDRHDEAVNHFSRFFESV